MNNNSNERFYPPSLITEKSASKPISFVVVRYSDEYYHNFLRSECIANPINEVIEVNNTANLYFDNLSQAIQHGVLLAKNELIAVVHEDVLLTVGWQDYFEKSLGQLEKHDSNWGVLGSVGWDSQERMRGHWSDPHTYKNLFSAEHGFEEVERLDEQLLLFHKSRLPEFDVNLPGIHHLSSDLSVSLRRQGLKTYVIDAPTIHKFADEAGQLVLRREDSKKILDRQSLTYLADRACCNEYIKRKYPDVKVPDYIKQDFSLPFADPLKIRQLNSPIILLARGGGASRLLSAIAQDAGIFLGNDISVSGDSLELVSALYQGVIGKYQSHTEWQKAQIVPRIRAAAAQMMLSLPCEKPWGFKLPENVFLLPELHLAFPNARYIHFLRDPLSTCLRRTHMTSRLDNHIGRITLPAAYDYLGMDRDRILADNPAIHMTYTTIHQLQLISAFLSGLPESSHILLKFERILKCPDDEIQRLLTWFKSARHGYQLETMIDPKRAANPTVTYPENIVKIVTEILKDIRLQHGYC